MPDSAAQTEPRVQRVSIFVGSLQSDGQAIPLARAMQQRALVADALAKEFGGASAEHITSRAQQLVGTYRHDETSGHGRMVDERIFRVWTAVTAGDLADGTKRKAVEREACRLRDALHQECVLVEWGREVWLTESAAHRPSRSSFTALDERDQEQFAFMAWARVEEPEDLCGVLCLGGWMSPGSAEEVATSTSLSIIAKKPGRRGRTAWCWKDAGVPNGKLDGLIRPGDLVVARGEGPYLAASLKTRAGYLGPRPIPLATGERPPTRLAIEFVLSALGSPSRRALEELLDAEGTTSRFYRDISLLTGRITSELRAFGEAEARGRAQRLMGQLLFVRFLEEKGWLPRQGLRNAWHRSSSRFYERELRPLFSALDTPPEERPSGASREVPYLNGGLFGDGCVGIDLPDALFDPHGNQPTALGLLYHYDFTLDESTSKDDLVSVDPAMLGRVLEGLTPDPNRKAAGVHYTPAPIARALARHGITLALASRPSSSDASPVSAASIEALLKNSTPNVSPAEAESISRHLSELRIVDPAVGSGALLVACLDVLLELETACSRLLGIDLRRGSYAWAKKARHFVTECLYGVDISPDAIAIARLRLWLYLAVGEEQPRALPDLGYNLRVGDSLRFDEAERKLQQELLRSEAEADRLEFDTISTALNQFRAALSRFRASGASPAKRAAAFQALEDAERGLRVAAGATAGEASGAPPFAWAIHFGDVFARPNRGFDLVIANPPYVRTSRLPDKDTRYLREHYRSMARGNVDLYYAFVERCFRAPVTPDSSESTGRRDQVGLAGRHGAVAIVLPNFSQVTSAERLRELLANGGYIERWVDFDHHQVFPTATNYVALLFATATRRHRKGFRTNLIDHATFNRMPHDEWWIDRAPRWTTRYDPVGWQTRSAAADSRTTTTVPLGDVANVEVGIQTSLDDFFLLEALGPDAPGLVRARNRFGETVLEERALFPCAKGSVDLEGAEFRESRHVLWLYTGDGMLMSGPEIRGRFPHAWAYLEKHRSVLEQREGGRFKDDRWWRFRRPQGVRWAMKPKIVVPSIMRIPTAFLDSAGRMICTASGKGGGGAWIITPREDATLSLERLAEFLRGERFGDWLRSAGDPKQGGWRGVDRKTLRRCPVPVSVLTPRAA